MSDSKTNSKIATFKLAVEAGPFETDEKFLTFLVECIQKAGLDKPEIVTQTVTTTSAPAVTAGPTQHTKKLTGYNIFMKEKMAEFKAQGVPVGDRMTKVSVAWKALKLEEQKIWKDKAGLTEPVVYTAKAQPGKKGPKTMTGYQLFVQQKMPSVKGDASILAKDRLGTIGKLWKALGATEKADFKIKAGIADAAKKSAIKV